MVGYQRVPRRGKRGTDGRTGIAALQLHDPGSTRQAAITSQHLPNRRALISKTTTLHSHGISQPTLFGI
ncbi:hypothetical protein, partial [Lentzea flava]|uniref:hypothetical protein n=1 Tax=Lentzea flava TaxID=103732 RepID=UPI001E39B87F